jgi:hypothetical protein
MKEVVNNKNKNKNKTQIFVQFGIRNTFGSVDGIP